MAWAGRCFDLPLVTAMKAGRNLQQYVSMSCIYAAVFRVTLIVEGETRGYMCVCLTLWHRRDGQPF